MNSHLSEEQLIQHVYGIGLADEHLNACPECRARLDALEERRALSTQVSEPEPAFYVRQRQAVMERLQQRQGWWNWRGASAVATCTVLAVGLYLYSPWKQADPVAVERAERAEMLRDAKLFEEALDLSKAEPAAAAPVSELLSAEGSLQ